MREAWRGFPAGEFRGTGTPSRIGHMEFEPFVICYTGIGARLGFT